ncbi:VOC family protein [Gordonia sp. PKS22-38]|uniref:VOC family protein n=1 Tax=Gordonia prachuapensis TaxID=3115651 RepID=A0ABU7MZL5_9ACTN|nr:VOC family protein [Gordonia sp. PKS22-38]
MKFSLHHVALSVSSIERSTQFYAQFGFNEALRYDAPDGSMSVSHLRLDGLILELFSFATPSPLPDAARELSTDLPEIGVKHFGLQVDSVADTLHDFIHRGLCPASTTITDGRTGVRYFFIADPDGILVEFLQDDRVLG